MSWGKTRLTTAKILPYYDVDENVKTQLIVNASPVGLGASLNQQQTDGRYTVLCVVRADRSHLRRDPTLKPKMNRWQ